MIRRMLAASALLMAVTGGTAAAQESPPEVIATTVPQNPPDTVRGTTVQGTTTLPRTGGDLDAELFIGTGLTAAGLAFAITARGRRRRFESAPVLS